MDFTLPDAPEKFLRVAETTIRDLAGVVINACHMRRDHPTYGYTKTGIRSDVSRLDGMIELYMVLADQTNSLGVSHLAVFTDERTDERVTLARRLVTQL